MNGSAGADGTASNRRYLWLIALLGLPVIGWSGFLDTFSNQQISGSISSAGLIYGTARGINALVSLLQGTEFALPFFTFSIGEVLDPVNDLIERFSEVILIALGSLALQKILLAVVSDTLFNVLLSIAALCAAASLFLWRPALAGTLLRVFLTITFLRFSLGVVVLANGWVDARFLQEADTRRHAAMEEFRGELREIDTLSQQRAQAEKELDALGPQIDQRRDTLTQLTNSIRGLDAQIDTARSTLNRLASEAGKVCQFTTLDATCPANVISAKAALRELEARRAALQASAAAEQATIDALLESRGCLQKRTRGEPCNLWDSLPDAPDKAALSRKLGEINENLSDFAENSINLLVSLLLKTIVIPLVFIYLLLMLLRRQWAKL